MVEYIELQTYHFYYTTPRGHLYHHKKGCYGANIKHYGLPPMRRNLRLLRKCTICVHDQN